MTLKNHTKVTVVCMHDSPIKGLIIGGRDKAIKGT